MMEIADVTLLQVALLIMASLIATYIRLNDEPKTHVAEIGVSGVVQIFVGAAIGGFIGMWALMSQNMVIDHYVGFLAVTATAYGGLASVRAAINTFKKAEPPPIA